MGTLGDFKQGSDRSNKPPTSGAGCCLEKACQHGLWRLPAPGLLASSADGTECLVAAEGELGEAGGHEAQDEDRVGRFG